MPDSLFDVSSLPPWMIQRQTPGDALVSGIAAGSQIAHNILAARSFALQQQESITQQQNSMRMREGLVAVGAYMGNIPPDKWSSPEAEAGAYKLLEQNPWLGQTPAFQQGINNFKTAQAAKEAAASREAVALYHGAELGQNRRVAEQTMAGTIPSIIKGLDEQGVAEFTQKFPTYDPNKDYNDAAKAEIKAGLVPIIQSAGQRMQTAKLPSEQRNAKALSELSQGINSAIERDDYAEAGRLNEQMQFMQDLLKKSGGGTELFTADQVGVAKSIKVPGTDEVLGYIVPQSTKTSKILNAKKEELTKAQEAVVLGKIIGTEVSPEVDEAAKARLIEIAHMPKSLAEKKPAPKPMSRWDVIKSAFSGDNVFSQPPPAAAAPAATAAPSDAVKGALTDAQSAAFLKAAGGDQVKADAMAKDAGYNLPSATTPQVSTQAQFDALPAGSIYIGTDGKKYRKP